MITTNQKVRAKVRGTSHGTVEEDDRSIVTGNQKRSGDLVLINSKFVSDVVGILHRVQCFPFYRRSEAVAIVGIRNMGLVEMPEFTPPLLLLLE